MSKLKAFNTQLENFLTYLENKFPDELSIKTYHTSISITIKVNARASTEFFIKYIYPFKEKIMTNDESFFMDKDYTEDVENDENSMLEVIKFKDILKTSTQEIKDQIFRYFQVLCLLVEQV